MKRYQFVEKALRRREETGQRRVLRSLIPIRGSRVMADDEVLMNFCSNDYLGLSKHPLLSERAMEFLERFGAGSTASRLVCGNFACFEEVEKKLALLKGTEAALLFNSGYQANSSLLPALTDRNSLILSDELNHNSIVNGALLSRCRVRCFEHNDLNHLVRLLEENRHENPSRIVIVTETVFSVDGDRSDVDALVDIAEEFDALLVVDEAHATGVLGAHGMGLARGKRVDLAMGTFGKACGSFGAYVACSAAMRDYLINTCSGFIYSTALPPSVAGSIDAALELIPGMDRERLELQSHAQMFRNALREMGWDTGRSTTQIVPVVVGEAREALFLSDRLRKGGILASALRPPTVSPGKSSIRFGLTALHTDQDLEMVVNRLRKLREEDGVAVS